MLAVEIVSVVLLTLLNGLFSMSELALVSSRRARLQQMAEDGDGGAQTALQLLDDPSRFFSTVQIGITMIGVVAGAYGGATLGDRLGEYLMTVPGLEHSGQAIGVTAVLVVITYLNIVLGELIPKRAALKAPEAVAARVARPMTVLSTAALPMVWLLGVSTERILRLCGLHGERDTTVTEEEVKSMITEGTQAGVFDPREKEMIDGVLRLADRTVRSIMVPRPDVVWLDVADAPDLIMNEIATSACSRFPVCRGEMDELVGVVHTRDLLLAMVGGQPLDLAALAAKPLVVHDGTPVLKLLDTMKATGQFMAVVVDEFGSVEGVVTMTDVLETIAGDMPEEPGEAVEPDAVKREDGSWLVNGAMPVDEFEDVVGVDGPEDLGVYHTVAGLVLHAMGRVPTVGETVEVEGVRYEVVDMDGRRIDKLLVTPVVERAKAA